MFTLRVTRSFSFGSSRLGKRTFSFGSCRFGKCDQRIKALGVGLLAGSCGSLVGMGGGFISIPLMTRVLKMTQHQAHATSLAAVTSCGIAGAASFALEGQVDWVAAGSLAVAGMVTANLGARATAYMSGPVLKLALGVLLLFVSVSVPLKPQILDFVASKHKEHTAAVGGTAHQHILAPALPLLAIGSGTGLLVGIFGIGGGSITVPALSFFVPELSHHSCLGTSLAAMVLPSGVGLAQHATTGHVVFRVAGPLAAGTAIGAFVGGKYFAQHLPEKELRWIFSCLMFVLGVRSIGTSGYFTRGSCKVKS